MNLRSIAYCRACLTSFIEKGLISPSGAGAWVPTSMNSFGLLPSSPTAQAGDVGVQVDAAAAAARMWAQHFENRYCTRSPDASQSLWDSSRRYETFIFVYEKANCHENQWFGPDPMGFRHSQICSSIKTSVQGESDSPWTEVQSGSNFLVFLIWILVFSQSQSTLW